VRWLVCMGLLLASCKREERTFQGGAYAETAYAISQGQQLYARFNCVGCHAHGGGGMGPPLMDDKWVYGSQPEKIFETITKGRPNGMPSFGSKIPPHQTWQLTSYVRSIGGLARKDAIPSRSDEMMSIPARNVMPSEKPKQ
jgi:cytochrome c oxidase cbb3-type subunit III